MNYATKTKKDLIDILGHREKEIQEFHSYYVDNDVSIKNLTEQRQVLVYLLLITFTFSVLF
jgi:hypothetical protein